MQRQIPIVCARIFLYYEWIKYSLNIGKSSTLKNIMSKYGAVEAISSEKTSVSSIMNQASLTTEPIGKLYSSDMNLNKMLRKLGVDNVRSSVQLEDLTVSFFNGFNKATISRGVVKPRTGLVVTSNSAFASEERYIHSRQHACNYQ